MSLLLLQPLCECIITRRLLDKKNRRQLIARVNEAYKEVATYFPHMQSQLLIRTAKVFSQF